MFRRYHARWSAVALVVGSFVFTARARAQYVVHPNVLVGSSYSHHIGVAVSLGGTLVFLTDDYSDGRRIFSWAREPLGSLLADTSLDNFKYTGSPIVAAGHGGFAAAWLRTIIIVNQAFRPAVVTRLLDSIGQPASPVVQLSAEGDFASDPSLTAVQAGWVAAWYGFDGLFYRFSSEAGTPIGGEVLVDMRGGLNEVVGTPDGGFVLAWSTYDEDLAMRVTVGRSFAPTGAPLGPIFPISQGFDFTDAAISAKGDVLVAIGKREDDPAPGAQTIVLRRFTAAGATVGGDVTVHVADEGASRPRAEFDLLGNVYVVWSEAPAGHGPGVRARAIDDTGTPLGPPVWVADGPVKAESFVDGVRTTRLPSGSFVNAWSDGFRPLANLVGLCAPGSSLCGDGVRAAACEECDDGPGNSATIPDACRPTCRRAHCGDGVVDTGEACDDGNKTSCDGCSATCQVEVGTTCGDGIVAAGCEQCDDANAIAGDGCSPSCRLERIPGGGSPITDCFAEWLVPNPTNVPLYDKHGAINPTQRCVDDDPACDFDGGVPGSCTFHVEVCANNTGISACEPGPRLASWEVTKPSASQAASHPELAAVRAAFAATVPSEIVGPSALDICTDPVSVLVPLRGTPGNYRVGKVKVGARARLYSGTKDTDGLKLICLPAAP